MNGMREGHDVYVRANGNRYDGQFANDDLVGHGIFTFAKDNALVGGRVERRQRHRHRHVALRL